MSEPYRYSAGWRFMGAILLAVGGLIATLSGLCSVVYLASSISDLLSGHGPVEFGPRSVPEAINTVAIVGGVPLLVGAGSFWVGWRLYRAKAKRPDVDVFK